MMRLLLGIESRLSLYLVTGSMFFTGLRVFIVLPRFFLESLQVCAHRWILTLFLVCFFTQVPNGLCPWHKLLMTSISFKLLPSAVLNVDLLRDVNYFIGLPIVGVVYDESFYVHQAM